MRAFVLAIFALLLLPVGATAAQPSGQPVALLDVSSPASALRASGVQLKTTGKAIYRFDKLGFTISDVALSGPSRGTFVLKDGFRIVKGRQGVSVRGMLVVVNGRNVTITGKVDGRRRTIFTGRAPAGPTIDGGRTALATNGAKLSLTKQALAVIRATFPEFKPASRRVGAFEASAAVVQPPPGGGGGTITPERSKECIAPVAGAQTDQPKPSGAIDLDCGFFTWAPRSSWINYLEVNSPVAPGLSLPPISPGDHYCPYSTTDAVDSYYFSLPVTDGWWDPATSTGALHVAGGVHFQYTARFLDITVEDLDVRLAGANSEIWATAVHSGAPSGEQIKFATFDAGTARLGGPVGPGAAQTRFDTTFTPYVASNLFIQYGSDPYGGCFDVGFNF